MSGTGSGAHQTEAERRAAAVRALTDLLGTLAGRHAPGARAPRGPGRHAGAAGAAGRDRPRGSLTAVTALGLLRDEIAAQGTYRPRTWWLVKDRLHELQPPERDRLRQALELMATRRAAGAPAAK